ncbi:MAG: Brp/Blh family beta-carotene 15,15'-monooxygenase [Halobacteriales archaeon]|jgi:Brp/Blh family beta-carotene 15,15'-monooxygenase
MALTDLDRAAGLDLDAAVRTTLVRSAMVPSWILVGVVAAVFVAGVTVPVRMRYGVLLASAVVFGVPHGALDHLVPGRLRHGGVDRRSVAAVVGLYAVLGVAYVLGWFVAPVVAFGAFILLTWVHWGQGDLHALLALADADHLPTRGHRAATAAVRGGLPMLVPLVAFPDRYRAVATAVIGAFGSEPTELAALFAPTTRAAVGLGLAAVAVATLGLGFFRGNARRGWAIDAGETGVLAAYFAVVPPVLAIGLYFTVWHSLRHVARLAVADPESAAELRAGRIGRPVARFARDAAPATVGALALFAPLWWLVPGTPDGLPAYAGLYLVLIAVLTLPHVVLVAWMDREQGVWRPA